MMAIILVAMCLLSTSARQVQGQTKSRSGKGGKTIGDILKTIESQKKATEIQKQTQVVPGSSPHKKEATRSDLRKVKPPKSSQLIYEAGTSEAELEKATDDAINQLYTLTQKLRRSPKRGELWLRLAESYVEKARLIEFKLQNRYDEQIAKFQAGQLKKKPVLNLKPAHEYNLKAIELYEWYLRDFPKDTKVDQALFFLGFNHFQMGDIKKGEEYYVRLTKEFPKSPFVDESNFALGEFHFENDRWDEAQKHYLKVAKNKDSHLFSLAEYKVGWCYYKQNKIDAALKSLRRVIYVGRQQKAQNAQKGKEKLRLASEAMRDYILFYGETGEYRNAKAEFRKVMGNANLNKQLERLAYFYLDLGNREAARFLFRDLIAADPVAPVAFDYQYQLVNMDASAGDDVALRRELFDWIDRYGPNSAWQRANAKQTQLLEKSNELIESTLRNYVLQKHQNAQNTRNESVQRLAKSGYELYFSTVQKSAKLDEMHFFFGELLFDMNQHEKAAVHYLWIAEKTPDSKYAQQALLNAMLALEKRLPSSEEIKKIVGETTERVEFDRTIKAFIGVAEQFTTRFPEHQNFVAVRYRVGTLHYFYNHYDEALKIFNEIVAKYPGTKFAEFSANNILDIHNVRQDFQGLEQAATQLLTVPQLAGSATGVEIRNIKERSAFKQAELLEKSKDYKKSADAFAAFAAQHPKSPLVVAAHFNAAVNFQRAGYLTEAIARYSSVSRVKAKSEEKIVRDSRRALGGLYEQTGQFARAAAAFEEYATLYPTDPQVADFYYNAAVLRDGMRQNSLAERNFEKYRQLNKKGDTTESLYLLAQIAERQKQYPKAIALYEKFLMSNSALDVALVESAFKVAQLSSRLKWGKKSDEWLQRTVNLYKSFYRKGKTGGLRYAAEARFNMVQKTYQSLRAIQLPVPRSLTDQRQGKVLESKINILQRLQNELKEVIAMDDAATIVAALALQGQAFQHMAVSLLQAPPPPGLDSKGLGQFRAALRQMEEKLQYQKTAIELYKSAMEKGQQLQVYTPWLLVAAKELAQLEPSTYGNKGFSVISVRREDLMELAEN